MKNLIIAFFGFLMLGGFIVSQTPDEKGFEPTYYENAKVLRIKYTEGETFVVRDYEEGMEEATVNLPVFEKDKMGTTNGRLELYMGRLNYLRIDNDTEIEFEKIPQLRKTNLSLRINKGSVYIDIENLDREKDIEIQTNDCGIFILDRGIYRIDVKENGQTEISVFRGIVEVCGEKSCRTVQENQKITMSEGNIYKTPFYFYQSEIDAFALWNDKRNGIVGYAKNSSSRYLDEGYEDYEYELTRNGRWRYHSTYGSYIWIPYNVDSNWRPYYRGRWVWNPFYGYVWSSYDSWGWFTHHYGRWHWDYYYGWYWIPAYHYSPAWVYWFWDNNYYGWCPLSYWNRPFIVINNRWNRHYNWRNGFPHHSRSTIIIRKKDLNASHINKKAIRNSTLAKFSNTTLISKGNAPRLRPAYSGVNVINKRNKPVLYKSSGAINVKGTPTKFKTIGPKSNNPITQKKNRYNSGSAIIKRNPPSKYSSGIGSKGSVYQKPPVKRTTQKSTTGHQDGSKVVKKKNNDSDSQMSWNPVYDDSESNEPNTNFNSTPSSNRYKSSGYTYKTPESIQSKYSSTTKRNSPKYKSYYPKSNTYSSLGKKYSASKSSNSYSGYSGSSGKSYGSTSKISSKSRSSSSRSYSSSKSSSKSSSSRATKKK